MNERKLGHRKREDKKDKDKKTVKDGKKSQEASESSEHKKQLVFPQGDMQTLTDASANVANPNDITSQEDEKPKKARLEEPSQTDDAKSIKSEASKSTTEAMALTTQRLQDLTMDTPVHSDGTKTTLKMPAQRSRTSSAATSESADSGNDRSSDKPEQEQEDEDMEEASLESWQLHTMNQTLQEVSYDVETQGRLNAHFIYKKLQDDAKQASLSLSLEGFPRETSRSDRKALVSWLLFEAENRDENYHVCYITTTWTR